MVALFLTENDSTITETPRNDSTNDNGRMEKDFNENFSNFSIMTSVPRGGGRGNQISDHNVNMASNELMHGGSAMVNPAQTAAFAPVRVDLPHNHNPTFYAPGGANFTSEGNGRFSIERNSTNFPQQQFFQPPMYQQYQQPQYYNTQYIPTHPYMPQMPMAPAQPMQQPQQQQQPVRQKKVLLIEDPNTHQAINLDDVQKKSPSANNTPNTTVDNERDAQKAAQLRKEMQEQLMKSIGTTLKAEVAEKTEVAPEPEIAPEPVKEEPKEEAVPAPVPEPEVEEPTPVPVVEPETVVEAPEVIAEVTTSLEKLAVEEKVETEISAEATDAPIDVSMLQVNPADEEGASPSISVEEVPETDETEPSAVSPSVDAEEEERRKEEEEAERIKQREAELDALHAKLMQDKTEFDLEAMTYNRAFLYCVRDIEKEFKRTKCPLTQEELKAFGIDIHSMPKQSDGKKRPDFNPPWARNSNSIQGNRNRNQYSGRNSHDHRGGRGGGGGGKKPYNSRISIDRPAERKVTLGNKAENAWKAEKLKPEDLENEENRIKLLLKAVRSLLNKITPTTKEDLIREWLTLKVSGEKFDATQEQLAQVVDIMFDKAVEEPKFCSLYSEICKRQVDHEVKHSDKKSSVFRNALLNRAQTTFVNKSMDDNKKAMEEEQDEEKKKQMAIDFEEAFNKFRRRKFGNINFIGQLYEQQLLSTKIIQWCLFDLMRHCYPDKDGVLPKPPYDDESLQCATQLIEVVGQAFERCNDFAGAREYFNQLFQHLKQLAPGCTPKIKFKIMGVIELRESNWRQRKTVEQGPKKLSEIHKDIQQEQAELANQRESYERKQSTGIRVGSHSLRKNAPPPSRNSLDARFSSVQKRAGAANASKLAPTSAAPRQMMSMSQASSASGANKKSWKTGSQGGGLTSENPGSRGWGNRNNGSREGSESRKNSNIDERNSAIAAAHAIGGGQRSNSQMSINSQEDDTEKSPEIEALQAKLANSISSDLGELYSKDMTMDEFVGGLLAYEGNSRYGEPSLADVFQRYAESYVMKVKSDQKTLAVQALNVALQGKKQAVIDGFANYCTAVVKLEIWEDKPNVWDVLAELLVSSIMFEPAVSADADEDKPRPDVPTLNDFSPVFVAAAKDPRDYRPYYLFICVLRMMAESFAKKDASEEMLMGLAMDYEGLACRSSMDPAKLDEALKNCRPDVAKFSNLYELLHH